MSASFISDLAIYRRASATACVMTKMFCSDRAWYESCSRAGMRLSLATLMLAACTLSRPLDPLKLPDIAPGSYASGNGLVLDVGMNEYGDLDRLEAQNTLSISDSNVAVCSSLRERPGY